MLLIREAQMRVFRDQLLQGFERARLEDIAKRFPQRHAQLGESGVRAIIRMGITACEQLDIHSEADVRDFIDLMIFYGEAFDRDAALAFETAPLRNYRIPPDARVALSMARLGVEPGFRE